MRTIEISEDGQVLVGGRGMLARWTPGFFAHTAGMFSLDMVEAMVELLVVTINLELFGLTQEPLSSEEISIVYQLISGTAKPQGNQDDAQELPEEITSEQEGEDDGDL